MRKTAIIFILAVIAPCLVLAALALRSLKDQQFVLERQQTLHCSSQTELLAAKAQGRLDALQTEFAGHVNRLLAARPLDEVSRDFHPLINTSWPPAEIGFVVSLQGEVLAPALTGVNRCPDFRLANDKFFCNTESVEVYWNSPKGKIHLTGPTPELAANASEGVELWQQLKNAPTKSVERKVVPVNPLPASEIAGALTNAAASGLVSSEAEFRQLVGDAQEGMFARFLQNELHVMLWYRSRLDPHLVFGAQLDLPRVREQLMAALFTHESGPPAGALPDNVALALLDDRARPVAVRPAGFVTDWKRPFAAHEIGEALPHWEVAAYLIDPRQHQLAAQITRWSLGGLTLLLVAAVAIGGWLIVTDVRRQLILARQKTDFVSNVSHELKTPLTSIRMFSELLTAKADLSEDKRRSYLDIIGKETGRLTRLIDNVLDFARLERDQPDRPLTTLDLTTVAREVWETQLPQLTAAGFTTEFDAPVQPVWVRGHRDGIAQILINLLSNAVKFSNGRREVRLELRSPAAPSQSVELRVLDRGCGVAPADRERIFEQFYRAHDSLTNEVGGVGLGLALARQIARHHGGDLVYRPREGGGSEFVFTLNVQPLATSKSQ